MNPDAPNPTPELPPLVRPAPPAASPPPPPEPPPRSGGGVWKVLLALFLFGSLGLNLILILVAVGMSRGSSSSGPRIYLNEKYLLGDTSATDKVAVVGLEGVIMEAMTGQTIKEIDRACQDKDVKAVVLRVVSPGGTITASDDLHRRLTALREGTNPRAPDSQPKKLVVSMGALAASGGYYVSMPGEKIFAEKTTLTGSIGVYASFYNLQEFGDKHGIKTELIKAGDIKGAGGLFSRMTPEERMPWQDMVNHAYGQFLDIVAEGREGKLSRADLTKPLKPRPVVKYDNKGNPLPADEQPKPPITYSRKIADGGIFTADEAKELKLVDEIGYLEDAVAAAAESAGLTEFQAIAYEQPFSLSSILSSRASTSAGLPVDPAKWAGGLTPRLWFLMPGAEAAGVMTATSSTMGPMR